MATVKVNADGVGWAVPNPIPNQGPLSLAAYRGQVVDIPDEEAERLRNIRVRVYYTDPVTGVPNGAYREEPSVVNASEAEEVNARDVAAKQQRIRDLEDQLAKERAGLPLVPTPTGAPPMNPVTLATNQAPRLIVDEPRSLDDEDAAKAQHPAKATGTRRA